ncbi:MAG: L-fucokinase [Planctomycetota bacterium]
MTNYDLCIITAANEIQAEGYRKQIAWRRDRGMLPEETDFRVVADPGGRRIGSGGSTIHVLHQLLRDADGDFDKAFRRRRILILHSGGDSRRLPAYSAIGKAFAPLPSEKFFAVFDALFDQLMRLPVLDEGQVVVASGDVLLTFESDYVAFAPVGVTGVAYPDLPQVAAGHGVYVANHNATAENPCAVTDFLQKPTLDELQAANALDLAHRAFVDTGIMNLALDAVERITELFALADRIAKGQASLDLYREITFALIGKKTLGDLTGLADVPFRVSQLPYCGFFHVGRSAQFLRSLHTLTHAGALYDFRNLARSDVRPAARQSGAFIYNTIIDADDVEIHEPALIEGCHIDGALRLDGENILTGAPQGSGNIHLHPGMCLCVAPVGDAQWAAILYGIGDPFKHALGDEGCTFLNSDLSAWMAEHGIDPQELWPKGKDREAWTARLFPVSGDAAESVRIALGLQTGEIAAWRSAQRMAMDEILRSADHDRLLDGYSARERRARIASVANVLAPESEVSTQELLSWCQDSQDYERLARKLSAMIAHADDLLFRARLCRVLSAVTRRAKAAGTDVKGHCPDALEDKALALIREAVGRGIRQEESAARRKIRIRSDEVVWVCLPARLDFAGGWLDTPPQCMERGGSVLNAAVTLNGQYPIQVIGKTCAEPVVRINSIDLGDRVVIRNCEELLNYSDPSDWLALPKSAFVAAGIVSPDSDRDLAGLLRDLGGGIDLTLFSAVPSGSGLGASSILGAGIIACLARIFGMELAQDDLFNRTMYMEQLMTTGGGWQDQIGGVVGGVKLIRTQPGLYQAPTIAWTDLAPPGMALPERFLLYYTGHRRMAKNILQHIVGGYLDRDPQVIGALNQLKRISVEMKSALDHRDVDAFGRLVARVWELNKQLDEGSTNAAIESILDRITPWTLGAKLLGAGGGGFLFIVTKGAAEGRKLKEELAANPPNDLARFFDFDVEKGGLKLSVL